MYQAFNFSQGASGPRRRWQNIIEGREHKTKYGYYCVRLPDDDGRTRFLKSAAKFFSHTSPWNGMNRNRFGIPNLVSDISRFLLSLIENK